MNAFQPCKFGADRRGVALVLTLALLVIASVLLLGFIATSQQNSIATRSHARGLQAEGLAIGALDQITGDLLSEIVNSSTPTNAIVPGGDSPVTLYPANAATNLVPRRLGVDTSNKNLVNLIRRSAVPQADSTTAAPTDNSTVPSGDGRWISLARWNKPQLLQSTDGFVAPDWIVVTRDGPKPAATDADVAAFRDLSPTNSSGAMGRFAYTVYDVGGLINVNVAGFPSGAASLDGGRQKGGKETAAWADLTQIGLSQEQIEALGRWRNNTTWNDPARYATNTAIDLATSMGFTRVQTGDDALLSRQELLSFAQANGLPSDCLPNLTTFSVAWNSASYIPPATATAADSARMQMGKYFLGGNPLRRFPLNTRLSLLEAGTDTASIAKYFGLSKGAGWKSPGYRFWQYDQQLVSGGIGTMEDAVKAGREPNFFEILKTAILNGSLGTQAGIGVRNSMAWEDGQIDNQVIRIGANIIDEHDADNFPTTIRFNGVNFYGIEDLPYFSEMFVQFVCTQASGYDWGAWLSNTATTTLDLKAYHYFELWNPHQATSTPAASLSPTKLQIRADSGSFTPVLVVSTVNYTQYVGNPYDTSQNWPATPIDVNPSTTDYRSAPHIVQDGVNNQQKLGSKPVTVNAFLMSKTWSVSGLQAGMVFAPCNWKNSVFVLEYSDDGVTYHPYTTLSGLADGNGTGGLDIKYWTSWINASGDQDLYPYMAFCKPDPRTDRLGVNCSDGGDAAHINVPMVTTGTAGNYASGGFQVNGYQSTYSGSNSPGGLVTNSGSTKAIDNDGVTRPGDAFLNEAQADPMTVPTARPVILNRPFRSVGELGYAFRDQPWKNVNLFSGASADAALLDVFCLTDAEKIAGQVNLNTQNPAVLAALLSGAVGKYTQGTSLDDTQAAQVASALTSFTASNPIATPAELVTQFLKSQESKTTAPFSAVKEEREAIIRALASAGQTRTWNLLIDVIAQTGRFPNTAATTTLKQFQVEGERRYWMHLAIDRLTGKVIAKRLEPVSE